MPVRHTGNLHVAQAVEFHLVFDHVGEITPDLLDVKEIQLQLQVFAAHLADDVARKLRVIHVVARHAVLADGFQQQLHAGGFCLFGCHPDVFQVGVVPRGNGFIQGGGPGFGAFGDAGTKTGHHVDAWALQCVGVFDGLVDAGGKFGFTAGNAGQSALTGVPVAGR